MANEVRMIDANALTEKLREAEAHKGMGAAIAGLLVRYIGKMPTIDPESLRPKGRWENYPSHMHRRCSICKVEWEKPRFNIRANYCPNCGAKMDG